MDDDYNVLTIDGWKQIKDIDYESKIACLKDGNIVYECPTDVSRYENHTGDFLSIDGDYVKTNVEMNQSLYCSRDFNGEYESVLAKNHSWDNHAWFLRLNKNEMFMQDYRTPDGKYEILDGTSDMTANISTETCTITCISVPSGVFYVRYKDYSEYWIGNSSKPETVYNYRRDDHYCLEYNEYRPMRYFR